MSKSADRYNGDSLISLQKRLVSAAFILLLFFLCLAQALTEEDPKARAEVQKVIEYPGDSGMTEELYPLRIMLEQLLYGQEGTWSIYIKDLETDEELSMNHQEMYAASLIKLFVMEKTYEDYDTVLENDMRYTGDLAQSQEKIVDVLTDMIQVSDNEAFNELVRIQNEGRSFSEGCVDLNDWLEEEGYEDTGIYHTLEPSPTEEERISEEKNHTSARDCGHLLEAVYRGEAVSQTASSDMLMLLLGQERNAKIPAGVPEHISVANKTGETDSCQHDAAIVFGESGDYILCVMSEGLTDTESAAALIQEISAGVYAWMEQ